ncbi:MAG: hypothetical protein WC848_05180 [Parcubacteria group bacterium]
MRRKPELGEIVFWPNHGTFGVVIDPEFWSKEAGIDYRGVKLTLAGEKVPLLLLGSLMALKFPCGAKHDPAPKVKHSNIYFLVHPADLFSIGSAEDLIRFCRCAVHFSGGNDRCFLERVSDEARAILHVDRYIEELAEFFAKAIPKK